MCGFAARYSQGKTRVDALSAICEAIAFCLVGPSHVAADPSATLVCMSSRPGPLWESLPVSPGKEVRRFVKRGYIVARQKGAMCASLIRPVIEESSPVPLHRELRIGPETTDPRRQVHTKGLLDY